jgi:tRNA A-37 threonylcarbamoyl transferase component Bud32
MEYKQIEYDHLDTLSFQELKDLAKSMDIPSCRSKDAYVEAIGGAFKEYDSHKRRTIGKYEVIEQMGGKDSMMYRVSRRGKEYAMKTFVKSKSSDKIRDEVEMQALAADAGVAPKVVEFDTLSKYIVMELMDCHLTSAMERQKEKNGPRILKYQQLRIIDIFNRLDDAGIFHNDSNLANFMLSGRDVYMIDFGFAKHVNERLIKKVGTERPNLRMMTISLILKLKELKCDEYSYRYLMRQVSDDDQAKLNRH